MASFTNRPGLGAFSVAVFPKGLDRNRCAISRDLGVFEAADAAVIRQGQFLTLDANGRLIPATGAGIVGVALHNKQQLGVSNRVDEAIVLNGTTPTNLKRANVSNVAVRSATNFGGTLYTATTDYVVNAANGTVARAGAGAIADGATVYVTYTFALTDADFEFDGRDFRNQSNNDVLGQENRLAVVQDWSMLFTMEYDTSRDYSTDTAGGAYKLYCSAEGKATSASGTDFVGRVLQLPTSDDPFLGMIATGQPAA